MQRQYFGRSVRWAIIVLIGSWPTLATVQGKVVFDDQPPATTRPATTPSPGVPAAPAPFAQVPSPATQPSAIPAPAPGPAPAKQVPPTPAVRAAVLKQVREIYAAEYADKSTSGRHALGQKLLAEALKTKDNFDARYVMLEESEALAVSVGDVETCGAVIDELDASYAVDFVELSALALAKLQTNGSDDAVCAFGIRAIDRMVAIDNYPAVLRLRQAGAVRFRQSKDPATRTALAAAEASAADYQHVRPELERLKKEPNNPAANLAAGTYYCFHKRNFAVGLPMLARGSDVRLKELAAKDLATPVAAMDRFRLGGAWWDSGVEKDGVPVQPAIRERAGYWYSMALPELTGLAKALAEKRLAAAPAPAALPTPTAPAVAAKNIIAGMRATSPAGAGADGAIVISRGKLVAPDQITVPFRADFIAKTNSTNVRLGFARGVVIFNWEMRPNELRHHDPSTGRITSAAGQGLLEVNKYATISWIIKADSSTVMVNGEVRAVVQGNYAGLQGELSIYPSAGSTVTVKSVTITQLGK